MPNAGLANLLQTVWQTNSRPRSTPDRVARMLGYALALIVIWFLLDWLYG